MDSSNLCASTRKLRSRESSIIGCLFPTSRSDQIKIMLMIALAKLIEGRDQLEHDKFDTEATFRRTGSKIGSSGSHSLTCSIEPIPKHLLELDQAEKFYSYLSYECSKKLRKIYPLNEIKRALAASIFTTCAASEQKPPERTSVTHKKPPVFRVNRKCKQNHAQNTQRNASQLTATHRRFKSDLTTHARNNKINAGLLRRRNEYFLSRKKEEIRFLQKTNIDFTSTHTLCQAMAESVEIFFKNISKTSHLLNMSGFRSGKPEQMVVYLKQLNKTYTTILDLVGKMNSGHESPCQQMKDSLGLRNNPFEEYFTLSQQVVDAIKDLVLTPNFAAKASCMRKLLLDMTQQLMTGRYLLRYLEKQIENTGLMRKAPQNLSRWQIAYKIKFMGRTLR